MFALLAEATPILRFLFIAIVQTGAYVAVSSALEKLVDYIRSTLQRNGGLTSSETDDVMLNETLDTLVLIGITVASLKTKIPVRLADKLGLRTASAVRKTIPAATKAKVQKAVSTGLLSSGIFKKYTGVLAVSFVGSLPWLPGLIQQFGDQATFAPKAANDYYQSFLGIRPFKEQPAAAQPGPFDAPGFKDYASALETQGIYTISNPGSGQSVPYSRQALTDLINYVYGVEVVKGNNLTKAKIIPLLAPYIRTKGSSTTTAAVSSVARATTVAAVAAPSIPKVQVFTGIVSQGVLGKGLEFQARPDDLIVSSSDLQQAAEINIAAFLAAIPSRFSYEIKVVASVTSKDGFTQRGTAQQVVSGYSTNGQPKYKTIVNKFAIANIYLLTDKGTKTKVATIVLGPTDAVNFRPGQNDVIEVENALYSTISTSNMTAINKIVVPANTAVQQQAPQSTPIAAATYQPPVSTAGTQPKTADNPFGIFIPPGSGQRSDGIWVDGNGNPLPGQGLATTSMQQNAPASSYSGGSIVDFLNSVGKASDFNTRANLAAQYGITAYNGSADQNIQLLATLRSGSSQPIQFNNEPVDRYEILYGPNTGKWEVDDKLTGKTSYFNSEAEAQAFSKGGGTIPASTMAGQNATTLAQYYSAIGSSLPSLAERAQTYQSAGLGSASLYAGTAEQNTRLLQYLKSQ